MIPNTKPSYEDLEKLVNELQSESKLKRSEERFNLLLKASEDMITIHKPDGEYLYYNGPTCYAITHKDVVGKMPKDLFDDEVSNQLLKAFEKVEKTGKSETLEVLLDWLGEKRWFSEYIYAIKNTKGEVVELVKVCRDIHKRKIAEQEIEKKNKKLNELNNTLNQAQELAGVGSWVFDPSSLQSEWSKEMFRIWGFDYDRGTPPLDLINTRVHPDDLALCNSSLDKAIHTGLAFDIEFRIRVPEVGEKVIRSISKPVLGVHGEVISLTGATQDITSQKEFEKAQIKHQRLKAIGEMSSSISHDFNNSLQQMMGNLEIIKKQTDLSTATLERLNSIGSIIDHVAERVNVLQEFGDAKHDHKKAKLINLNTMIEESLIESRPLWKDGMEKEGLSITITTDLEEVPEIRCNRGELKSAIYNLIKNSIEAMPKGGNIAIQTGLKPNGLFATFTDTGIGMDEETKQKVFNPFFSTKGFKLGRGLGMSGVYSTIKKYGGEIRVKSSEMGEGTTFEMVFPIAEPDEIQVSKEVETKNKETLDVLWVDDDKMITENVLDLLAFTNHRGNVVNSAKEALAYIDENECDIVFTDIGMPEMNGWELASAIRNKFGDKIKIVLVSGWSVQEKDKEAYGVDFILQKPFSLSSLESIFLHV